MVTKFLRSIIGERLPSTLADHQRLNKTRALAVFSSDALSSVAYGTEEILLVLCGGALSIGAAANTGFVHLSWPIALVIVALLAIIVTSYYQTIHAYPRGAGSYIVTRENLGTNFGLTAAAALLVDYVLTVAVSVSAGVLAITSALPAAGQHSVILALLVILFITLANLRGIKESGTLFAVPTYAFVIMASMLIIWGLFRFSRGEISPLHPMETHRLVGDLGIFMLLKAFSSGCTALTGIEAISDGVAAFRKPESHNASITLLWMAAILSFLFLGITYLAMALNVAPVQGESVVSQLGRLVFGNESVIYYTLQATTMLILVIAANTAFADFPRLASILAADGFAPRQLANLGDRLVFSNGIALLAVMAGVLVIIFGANPHHLIPLYAVGVFISFTLSQAGMVVRWRKIGGPGSTLKALINGIGTAATAIVLATIILSKFAHGAWMVLAIIPPLIIWFRKTKLHYLEFERHISITNRTIDELEEYKNTIKYKVVLPISQINRATLGAVQFAKSMSNDVTAAIVNLAPEKTAKLLDVWREEVPDVPLVVLESPYRSVIEPLVKFLEEVDSREPEKGLAVVVLPEMVPGKWWQNLLHNQTALLLKAHLLYRNKHPGHSRIVINVPYRLAFD